MTFSIVGQCERTGMLGVAITTSSICVGARCPWARAAVGAVSSQNVTHPGLGSRVLDLLGEGLSPQAALDRVAAEHPHMDYRQISVVDAHGRVACHSGSRTLGRHAVSLAERCVAAGNLLADPALAVAMTDTYSAGRGMHLAARLLASLQAGLAAGGEEGPVHSAALLVVDAQSWPLVDLRVDWDDSDPLARLGALWDAYEPQVQDYLARALDPTAAPAYGVPGDR